MHNKIKCVQYASNERYFTFGEDSLRECEVDSATPSHIESELHKYDARCCIIFMERYRSGHNGADSKSVCAQAHEGSNPSLSAKNKTNSDQSEFVLFFITNYSVTSIQTAILLSSDQSFPADA